MIHKGTDVAALDDYLDSRANLTSLLIMTNGSPDDCALEKKNVSLSNAVLHDAFKVYMSIIDHHANQSRLQMRKALRKVRNFIIRFSDCSDCPPNIFFSGFVICKIIIH